MNVQGMSERLHARVQSAEEVRVQRGGHLHNADGVVLAEAKQRHGRVAWWISWNTGPCYHHVDSTSSTPVDQLSCSRRTVRRRSSLAYFLPLSGRRFVGTPDTRGLVM